MIHLSNWLKSLFTASVVYIFIQTLLWTCVDSVLIYHLVMETIVTWPMIVAYDVAYYSSDSI